MTALPLRPAAPNPVMSALASGVPLTLLLDLAPAEGPESVRIFARETADLSWLAGLPGSVAAPQGAQQYRSIGSSCER